MKKQKTIGFGALEKLERAILCEKCKRAAKYPNSQLCLSCLSKQQEKELDGDRVQHPEKYMHGFPKRFISWEKKQLLPHYQKLLDKYIDAKGLYLEGIQGAGKTCFITAFIKEYVKVSTESVWFVNAVSLMYEVKGTFDKESKFFNDYDVIMKYAKKPILVIDDLGSEKSSEYVRQSFYALINHRYLEDMKTFITSYHSLEALSTRYDASIASRIAEMCETVDMGNTDLRLERRGMK